MLQSVAVEETLFATIFALSTVTVKSLLNKLLIRALLIPMFFPSRFPHALMPLCSIPAFVTRGQRAASIAMPKVVKPRSGKVPAAFIDIPKAEYYFEDGLRKVRAYNQTFYANVKQRWINRTVPEVFASEMPRRCTKAMIV